MDNGQSSATGEEYGLEFSGFDDLPIGDRSRDWLGVGDYAEALATFVRQCPTPITIAIQGPWGAGKTSMMKLIEGSLNDHVGSTDESAENSNIKTLWFNTWQFSQFTLQEDMPIVFLSKLLQDLEVNTQEIKRLVKKLLKNAAILMGGVVAGADGSSAVSNTIEKDISGQIEALKTKLKKAVMEKFDSRKNARIVIFVDDLDRLNPEKAVEFLEVIKTFLDIPGCVFVLAVDYEVITRGIRNKYGADMDEAKSRSFFDKIIQLPFNLPTAQYNISEYLDKLLNIGEESPDLGRYRDLAKYSIGTNPRTLKRMANSLKITEFVTRANSDGPEWQDEFRLPLFGALCLQMAYEPVYARILEENLDPEKPAWKDSGFVDSLCRLLEKCPGYKPELEEQFRKFFRKFNSSLNNAPGAGVANVFRLVMQMSGIYSSDSRVSEKIRENRQKFFDPALLEQLAALCEEIAEDDNYVNLWKNFWNPPYISGYYGEKFFIPLYSPDMPVYFFIVCRKTGFYAGLQKYMAGKNVPGKFRAIMGRDEFIDIAKRTNLKKGDDDSGGLFTFIPWNARPEDDGFAETCRKQLKNYIKQNVLDSLSGNLAETCQGTKACVASLQKLGAGIAEVFRKNLKNGDGFRHSVSTSGYCLGNDNNLLEITNINWPEDLKITIGPGSVKKGDNWVPTPYENMNMQLAMFRKPYLTSDELPEFKNLRNIWLDCLPDDIKKHLPDQKARSKTNAPLWIFLPDNCEAAWIGGSPQAGYKYRLSSDDEDEILRVLESYAVALTLVVHDLDSFAEKYMKKLTEGSK